MGINLAERHKGDVTVAVKEASDEAIETIDDDDWISGYSAVRVSSGLSDGDNGSIVFPSEAQARIWCHEIEGQLSDGAWENYWTNSPADWKQFTSMNVEVDEELDQIELEDEPRFARDDLDFVGNLTEYDEQIGRMLFFARTADIEFDEDELSSMLWRLEEVFGF